MFDVKALDALTIQKSLDFILRFPLVKKRQISLCAARRRLWEVLRSLYSRTCARRRRRVTTDGIGCTQETNICCRNRWSFSLSDAISKLTRLLFLIESCLNVWKVTCVNVLTSTWPYSFIQHLNFCLPWWGESTCWLFFRTIIYTFIYSPNLSIGMAKSGELCMPANDKPRLFTLCRYYTGFNAQFQNIASGIRAEGSAFVVVRFLPLFSVITDCIKPTSPT